MAASTLPSLHLASCRSDKVGWEVEVTGDNCHYIRPLPESGLVMAVVPAAHLSASLHSACMRLSAGMMNWIAISTYWTLWLSLGVSHLSGGQQSWRNWVGGVSITQYLSMRYSLSEVSVLTNVSHSHSNIIKGSEQVSNVKELFKEQIPVIIILNSIIYWSVVMRSAEQGKY